MSLVRRVMEIRQREEEERAMGRKLSAVFCACGARIYADPLEGKEQCTRCESQARELARAARESESRKPATLPVYEWEDEERKVRAGMDAREAAQHELDQAWVDQFKEEAPMADEKKKCKCGCGAVLRSHNTTGYRHACNLKRLKAEARGTTAGAVAEKLKAARGLAPRVEEVDTEEKREAVFAPRATKRPRAPSKETVEGQLVPQYRPLARMLKAAEALGLDGDKLVDEFCQGWLDRALRGVQGPEAPQRTWDGEPGLSIGLLDGPRAELGDGGGI